MAPHIDFGVPVSITYIGTATAIIHIDGVNFLTDPVFSPGGTEWDVGGLKLTQTKSPAYGLASLPPIDAVLLSHEDHPDNLDEPGRQLLDGRRVFTTPDGARKLGPRPGVRGLKDWETTTLTIGGREFSITATPCEHLPGGECIGFVVSSPSFGTHSPTNLPNALYFSGDTVHVASLGPEIRGRWHVAAALLNLGKASVGELQITMDGAQGVRLFGDVGADLLVPMHFEAWQHFAEDKADMVVAFEGGGILDRVLFLELGVETLLTKA
ncbi:beta-lactamase superfamily domain-containing protein [Lasiosphaeria ovina]|uniref:Beta-lactamase superfamily domain-containing protein n=1 Tax=Lasiosphaeria ovina TaxID=92902 RepID=A0AAE0K057_9PEZI|nr:beta-lactamase superfamily domain-containing protein [Lasiosphaeria ovina]